MNSVFRIGIASLAMIAACTQLAYKDDTGFLVSAQANSPEYPVYINGKMCVDTEGYPGACTKRIGSTEDAVFKFDPQPYAYLLSVACGGGIKVPSATVPKDQPYAFTITADQMASVRTFVCIGQVSPQDRSPSVPASFNVTIVITDARYVAREKPFITSDHGTPYLVLGEFARDAWVYDDGEWSEHSEEPMVEIEGDPKEVRAYSSSFNMRFNYFGVGRFSEPLPF